jgi:ribosome-binding protein aMBF1 (putative translation factor)
MDFFEEIEAALGFDMSDPSHRLAQDMAFGDDDFLEELVKFRIGSGMTREQVAHSMNRSVDAVKAFETVGADPSLATIRRYAHAIGVRVTHTVEKAF